MTEPTTQALAELRRLAVEADQIGMGWTLHSGDKMNVYSTFPFGDDYHIARFFEDVCAAFSVAANPAKVIELLDALEAQAREIERLQVEAEQLRKGHFDASETASVLRAELAAIRAVPVADVNAGLVEDAARYRWLRDNFTRLIVSTTPVCLGENDDGTLILRTYVQHVYVNENFRFSVSESVDQAVDTARTQQAQKGGE
jgi:hypothetical protein